MSYLNLIVFVVLAAPGVVSNLSWFFMPMSLAERVLYSLVMMSVWGIFIVAAYLVAMASHNLVLYFVGVAFASILMVVIRMQGQKI